jgi:hypothetical protein
MAQINKPNEYFNTVLYTGDDASPRTVTGVNFQPDFTWIKRRDNSGANHILYDSVRGAGSTKELSSNSSGAEGAILANTYGYLSAFASDGFTLTDGTDGANEDLYTNQSGATFVSWNWLASNTTASNTDGSITSTVSANTTSGFSIVSYCTGTGSQTTVGHGLGVTPKMIIVKRLQNAEDFAVYHASNGAGTYQSLNTTEAKNTNSNRFNVAPTNQVFTVNTHESVNFAENYIAYCFAEKKGFSKFGSYTGNGSADGTFVYTGFKPAMVIRKRSDGVQDWLIHDNRRTGINQTSNYISTLKPNSSTDEVSYNEIDILSNGFKMRDTGTHGNASGGTYIYMAFAENPLVGTNNIPTTAR